MKKSDEISVQVMDDLPVRNTATDTGCLIQICKNRVPNVSFPAPRGTTIHEALALASVYLRME